MMKALILSAAAGFLLTSCLASHAAGSMAQDVKIIHVGPSGGMNKVERKLQADIARDNNRAQNQMILEDQKAQNQRQLS